MIQIIAAQFLLQGPLGGQRTQCGGCCFLSVFAVPGVVLLSPTGVSLFFCLSQVCIVYGFVSPAVWSRV